MEKTKKDNWTIKRNFIYNTLYQVLVLIVPLITTPYVSRVLGAANIGIYSYASSLVSYFALFSLMGIHNYAVREIAFCKNKKERSQVFNQVETTKLFSCFVILGIYVLFIMTKSSLRGILLILSITFFANYFDITWFFQGQQNFKVIVIRNCIVKIVGVLCVFVFVKSCSDLYIYAFINMLSTLIGNISLWVNLKGNIFKFCLVLPSKYLIKTTLELFVPMIAIQVYSVLDKIMLGAISADMTENGYYEQTTKIITLALMIVTSLTTVLGPKMAACYINGDYEYIRETAIKTFHYIAVLSMPVCFGVMAISDVFVPWFFGDGYEKVALLLKIYSLVLIIIPISNVAGGVVLTPTKQHNKGTIAVISGAIVNFGFNMFLIPHFASAGAAGATIIAESVVSFFHLLFVKKYICLRSIIKDELIYLLGSIVMGICVYGIGNILSPQIGKTYFLTVLQILIGITIYGIYVVLVVKDKEIIMIISKIKEKLKK